MTADPKTFGYFRRGEPFRYPGGKSATTALDHFRRGEPYPGMIAPASGGTPGNASGAAPSVSPAGLAANATGAGSAAGTAPAVSLAGPAATATGAASASGTVPSLSAAAIDATATGAASAGGTVPSVALGAVDAVASGGGTGIQGGGSSSAVFAGQDTTTQGTWLGTYGSLGYYKLVGATPTIEQSLPSGLAISVSTVGGGSTSWAAGTSDVRALQRADGSTRDADTWYVSSGPLTFAVAPSDSSTRRLRVYCLDYDNNNRGQTVAIQDHATGTVLDSQALAAGSFLNGTWLSWDVTGAVDLVVTFTNPSAVTSVASGLFLDTPGGAGNASGTAASVSLVAIDAAATGAASAPGTPASVSLSAPAVSATGGTSIPGNASGAAPALGLVALAAAATGAASVACTPPSVALSAPAGSAGVFSPGDATGTAAALSPAAVAGTATGAGAAAGMAPALSLAAPGATATGAAIAAGLPATIGLVAGVSGIGSLVFVPNFGLTTYPEQDGSAVTIYPAPDW